MAYPKWMPGSSLAPSIQREILAAYIYRHTGEHKPAGATVFNAKPSYATDAEWLAHTWFAVTADFRRLDRRVKHCRSHDGWSAMVKDIPPR